MGTWNITHCFGISLIGGALKLARRNPRLGEIWE